MNTPFKSTAFTFEALAARAEQELLEAEQAAWKANRRRWFIEKQVIEEQCDRNLDRKAAGPTPREIKAVVDKNCSISPDWKANVNANRWHLDQATAFGIAAMVAAEQERRDEQQ